MSGSMRGSLHASSYFPGQWFMIAFPEYYRHHHEVTCNLSYHMEEELKLQDKSIRKRKKAKNYHKPLTWAAWRKIRSKVTAL